MLPDAASDFSFCTSFVWQMHLCLKCVGAKSPHFHSDGSDMTRWLPGSHNGAYLGQSMHPFHIKLPIVT
eukprot:scaffold275783_cov17-Tisochrysis_lutea.AAC.1